MTIKFPYSISVVFMLATWAAWFKLAGTNPFSTVLAHWDIALTMVLGSFIAGATSEGGGAVAFPVFTKLLHISPHDTKVFSLAIQSVGMSAASIFIITMRIPVEWRVILWATLGGVFGISLGAIVLFPLLPAEIIKMSFTMMITSFAVTLYLLNRHIRHCHTTLPTIGTIEKALLFLAGFVGGIMSGLVGNGIDIITFSLIVLLFRLSEKVATPTSVILMAINAIFGFCLHLFILQDFSPTIEAYWLAAVPIVVVGAPVGALFCSYLNRNTIASILYALIFIELFSSLLIIPLTQEVLLASLCTLSLFAGLYLSMYRSTAYLKN